MKKLDLQKIIREEIRNVIKEAAASKAQQQAAGIALSVKRGDAPASKLKDAGKAMSKMSEKELEKIAGTKHDNLPKKVKKESKLTEATVNLKLGEMYQVYDPGMDTWNDEYEYLGFDVNSREYMFKAFDAPVDYFHFVGITKNDLAASVKPSEI